LAHLTEAIRGIISSISESEIKLPVIQRHLQTDSAIPVSAKEIIEALHILAEDNVIVYNENRKTVRILGRAQGAN
jgi:hypothetical protein